MMLFLVFSGTTYTWLFIIVTGAIKFGDELSVEQCASVLRRLARCRLPFQCAHGRPSCVPLYNISSVSKAYSNNGIRVSSPKNDNSEIFGILFSSISRPSGVIFEF